MVVTKTEHQTCMVYVVVAVATVRYNVRDAVDGAQFILSRIVGLDIVAQSAMPEEDPSSVAFLVC